MLSPMEAVKNPKKALKRLVGHVNFNRDSIEPAAARLQQKYEEGDYTKETFTIEGKPAGAKEGEFKLTIMEVSPNAVEDLRLSLSDQHDRLLGIHIGGSDHNVAVMRTTVEKTTRIIAAELVRYLNNEGDY